MPNPTEISLLNYNFEAKACNELLTAMLNHSDFDQSDVVFRIVAMLAIVSGLGSRSPLIQRDIVASVIPSIRALR